MNLKMPSVGHQGSFYFDLFACKDPCPYLVFHSRLSFCSVYCDGSWSCFFKYFIFVKLLMLFYFKYAFIPHATVHCHLK